MATNNVINEHNPQPLFMQYLNANAVGATGDGTRCYFLANANNPVLYDQASNINPAGQVDFTAKVAGYYRFTSQVQVKQVNAAAYGVIGIYCATSNPQLYESNYIATYKVNSAGNLLDLRITTVVYANANDVFKPYVTLYGSFLGTTIMGSAAAVPVSWWSGYLIR